MWIFYVMCTTLLHIIAADTKSKIQEIYLQKKMKRKEEKKKVLKTLHFSVLAVCYTDVL